MRKFTTNSKRKGYRSNTVCMYDVCMYVCMYIGENHYLNAIQCRVHWYCEILLISFFICVSDLCKLPFYPYTCVYVSKWILPCKVKNV